MFFTASIRELVRAPCRRLIPKVLVHLGHLRGLIYSSDKGTQGAGEPTSTLWKGLRGSPATRRVPTFTSLVDSIGLRREESKG